MGTVDKDTIEELIVPHLNVGKRGFKPKIPIFQVVMAIFYRLKTGCQWRELPVKQFTGIIRGMSWQSVYYYFGKWSKDGSWKRVWVNLLKANHKLLYLSSVQLDGSHTPAKRGGQAVGLSGQEGHKDQQCPVFDRQYRPDAGHVGAAARPAP